MRLLLLCALLFVSYWCVKAQPIFRPFSGEQEIIKSAGKFDDTNSLTRCGDYFLLKTRKDYTGPFQKDYEGKFQKDITFKVHLPKDESHKSEDDFVVTNKETLIIKLDNRLQIPTAQWQWWSTVSAKPFQRIIIRMSKKDFKAATCISKSS